MKTSAASRRHLSSSPFRPAKAIVVEEFAVGDLVTNDKYGLGRVVSVELGLAVVVDFEVNTIRLNTPFATTTKI